MLSPKSTTEEMASDPKAEIRKFLTEEQPDEDNDDTDYRDDADESDDDDADSKHEDTIEADDVEIDHHEADQTVEEAVSGDAEFSLPGMITPAQVLRSGKKVWSEVRATTLEKAEFDDEDDSDFEDAEEEDEDEELEEADPVNEDELRQIVKEGDLDPETLKSARVLRDGKEIKDEKMEDVTARIKQLMN
ncbi:hypothetical protein M427DRAFT_195946 [Gonapodya prolifera JEL478]|uniref:Uncharacterized protein n=1 Tax=Gonapodya prolifera (strain JEL478) TaxID=1344416 RepID=A0A139APE7_GONPJ|nr:hypothetical protein M427DRAFT_195946 [Gonapodya prolifera JEL478]|eukprot:KXS18619.1 hypothetical protein M427DRAFT_195946 [Gonapodya prolifera JEL478]